MSAPIVLGIAAAQHNGSACLMRGDEIITAIQEERITRRKRQGVAACRPSAAVDYVLQVAGVDLDEVDLVVICPQTSRSDPEHDVHQNPQLVAMAAAGKVRYLSHHLGHALSVLAWSGARDAAILVVDGVGSPWEDLSPEEQAVSVSGGPGQSETISGYHVGEGKLTPVMKALVPTEAWLQVEGTSFPRFRSLGGMYSAFAHRIFGDALEAGKVMGLAPYGRPSFRPESLVVYRDGEALFPTDTLTAIDRANWDAPDSLQASEAAASAQLALETTLLEIARDLRARTEADVLCFAGGVALNAIANELLLRESGFHNVSVIPAAEDAGTALGAAIYGLMALGYPLQLAPRRHDFLGRKYEEEEILAAASAHRKIIFGVKPTQLARTTAEHLARGAIGGWCQGGSEFGPRALGHRSILADPRRPDTKVRLDSSIKRREPFRPYAPMVLASEASNWFEMGPDPESPFMLRVVMVRNEVRAIIPAVVHVDGSARVQTVGSDDGMHFELLQQFRAITGVPVLLNTSFNGYGEPIVETPHDAFVHFVESDLDFCVFDQWLFEKHEPAR
jgi:carbamoyltransferase